MKPPNSFLNSLFGGSDAVGEIALIVLGFLFAFLLLVKLVEFIKKRV